MASPSSDSPLSQTATSPTPATPPSGPSHIINGRYDVLQWLRRTTLSDDYLAHDVLLDREVVFKALLPELAVDRAFIERFRAQAQSTANLTHPALAAVFDWGRDPNGIEDRDGPTYYLVGERVAGRTVSELIASNGAMPLDRAVHVLVGVTSALSYAHRAGVLHGGITPDGVIVSPTGVVKVLDLGLNVALGPSWQPPSDHPELALWRAPEQFRGEAVEPRTDVYQVGLLAYYLTTGKVPFSGETAGLVAERHLRAIPPAPSKLNDRVPKALESIVGRSMAKERDERYATVNEQRNAFVRFREANPRDATGTPTTDKAGPVSELSADEDATMVALARPQVPSLTASAAPAAVVVATEVAKESTKNTQRAKKRDRKKVVDGDGAIGAPQGDFSKLHETNHRRTAVYAVVLLVLLALLGGLLVLLYKQLGLGSNTRADIVVPSVIGRPSAEAETAIANAGLISETVTEANSSVAADNVFDQSPSAGSKVAGESKVIIKVSSGAAVPTVPNVVGDTVDIARSKLLAAGFPMAVREKADDSQPAGTVISQEPRPDATAASGATVTVVVATSTGTVPIPDVAGTTNDEARLALTKSGFRISSQTEASPTVEKGKVTRTDPAAGQKVERGAAVIIYVSGGNAVAVPSVLGQDQTSAVTTLSALGFTVDVTARPVVDPADAGKVVSQTPLGGKDADPGSAVVIRVGQFDASATSTKKPRPATTIAPSAPPSTAAPEVPATPAPTPPPTAAPEPPPPTPEPTPTTPAATQPPAPA